MTNMTLSIPEELMSRMRRFSEIKWSEVVRKAIEERVNDLEVMNKIASKSKLTKRDVEEIGKKIKRGMSKRFDEYSSNR
ncbi:MAG: hypothetical protein AABX66_02825 [Nanoarchaeota archaeon]